MEENFAKITNIPLIKKFFNQIIPLVFTDEFSYTELIAKLTEKTNELIENNNQIPNVIYNMVLSYVEREGMESVLADLISDFMLNVKYPPENIPAMVGDGMTDDTNSFIRICEYSKAHGYLPLFFPSGNYLINGFDYANISIFNKLTLVGYGRETTTIKCNNPNVSGGLFASTVNNSLFECRNITLDGTDGDFVIDFSGATPKINLSNVRIKNATSCFNVVSNGFDVDVNNVIVEGFTDVGIYLQNGSGTTTTNLTSVILKSTTNNIDTALQIENVNNVIFSDSVIQINSGSPITTNGNNGTFVFSTNTAVPCVDNGINNNFITAGGQLKLTSNNGKIEFATNNDVELIGENVILNGNNNKLKGNVIIDTNDRVRVNQPLDTLSPYFKALPIIDSQGNNQNVLIANENIDQLKKESFTHVDFITSEPKRVYIDGVSGNDDSANPYNPSTPIKTVDKLLSFFAEGQTDVRAFIVRGGTYNVTNLDTFNGITLHISATAPNVIINFTSDENHATVFYNCHVNFIGDGDNNTLKFTGQDSIYFENSAVALSNVDLSGVIDNTTGDGAVQFWGCYVGINVLKAHSLDFIGSTGYVRNVSFTMSTYLHAPMRIRQGSNIRWYGGQNTFAILTSRPSGTTYKTEFEGSTIYFDMSNVANSSYDVDLNANGCTLVFGTANAGNTQFHTFFNSATFSQGLSQNNPVLNCCNVTALNPTTDNRSRIVVNGSPYYYDRANSTTPFVADTSEPY